MVTSNKDEAGKTFPHNILVYLLQISTAFLIIFFYSDFSVLDTFHKKTQNSQLSK